MIIKFTELRIDRKYARVLLRHKREIEREYRDLLTPIEITSEREVLSGYEAIIRAKAFGLKALPYIIAG